MTNTEYQELIEFLGGKFTEVDARFAQVDASLDQMSTKEELWTHQAEIRRHFEVVAEGLRADIRQVPEGHQFLVDGQARIIDRIDRLEHELGAMIRFSYAELERRIRSLEEGMASLQERVARVEARQT